MPRARLARMKSLLFLAAALRGRPHECPLAHRLRPALAGSAAARRLVDQRAPAADRGPAQVHARPRNPEIGRANVRTPVPNAHSVCSFLLEKKHYINS